MYYIDSKSKKNQHIYYPTEFLREQKIPAQFVKNMLTRSLVIYLRYYHWVN